MFGKGLSKKDIVFIFITILLILIIGGLIVGFVYVKTIDSKVIVEQISFASSLVSILLALVAIIYAFFQSYESSRQNYSVEINLNKISSKVDEFTLIKEAVVHTREEISNKIVDLQKDITKTIEKVISKEEDIPDEIQGEIIQHLSLLEDKIEQMNSTENSQDKMKLNLNLQLHNDNDTRKVNFYVYATHSENGDPLEKLRDIIKDIQKKNKQFKFGFGNVNVFQNNMVFRLSVYSLGKVNLSKEDVQAIFNKCNSKEFKINKILSPNA